MDVLFALMQSVGILMLAIGFVYWAVVVVEICKAAFQDYDTPPVAQPMRFERTLGYQYLTTAS